MNQKPFPWILGCFDISALDFSKLIEPIVMEKEGILSREMIKKLNTTEEKCLQELVWTSDSPLWEMITKEQSIPNYDAVGIKRSLNGESEYF